MNNEVLDFIKNQYKKFNEKLDNIRLKYRNKKQGNKDKIECEEILKKINNK